MILILDSLVEMGANVKLEVTPADLKMFAESVAQRMLVAYDESEREQTTRNENDETYYNTKQGTRDVQRVRYDAQPMGETRLFSAGEVRQ